MHDPLTGNAVDLDRNGRLEAGLRLRDTSQPSGSTDHRFQSQRLSNASLVPVRNANCDFYFFQKKIQNGVQRRDDNIVLPPHTKQTVASLRRRDARLGALGTERRGIKGARLEDALRPERIRVCRCR